MRCNGNDDNCESCNGSGVFKLTSCPWHEIDRETIELQKHARAAERHLPLAGGTLDQTQSFMDALDWITTEQRRWEAETLKG